MRQVILDLQEKLSAPRILKAALAIKEGPECDLVVQNPPDVFGDQVYEGDLLKDHSRGLAYLQDMVRQNTLKNQVFLGGACNPTTWRKDTAIPMLEDAGCLYWNPQIENWETEHQRLLDGGFSAGLPGKEAEEKARSYLHLFVFSPQTRGIATLAEVVDSALSGHKVVVVIKPVVTGSEISGQVVSEKETRDLNLSRSELYTWCLDQKIPVFTDLPKAIAGCIKMLKAGERNTYIKA